MGIQTRIAKRGSRLRAGLLGMCWTHVAILATCALLAGCVTVEKGNRVNDAIGAEWKPEIESLLRDQGAHAFAVPREQAFVALLRTFQSLGMTIDERAEGTGLIRASAVGPTPLSPAEWDAATAGEIPRLKEIITEEFGPLAVPYASINGLKFVSLTPGANRLLISATIEGDQSGGSILLSARTSQLVVGITGATHQPSYPPPQVAGVAVRKIWSEFDNQIRIANATPRMLPAAPNVGQSATGVEQRQQDLTRKAEEDRVKLEAEEPAIFAKYRDCIYTNAARLALISDEPAEVVVSAAYAACHLQREALVELHMRYGDPGFDDRTMDEVEHRVAGALELTVIQARAARRGPPPPQMAPGPTSPVAPEEHSI